MGKIIFFPPGCPAAFAGDAVKTGQVVSDSIVCRGLPHGTGQAVALAVIRNDRRWST
jgi:hypothetical protein